MKLNTGIILVFLLFPLCLSGQVDTSQKASKSEFIQLDSAKYLVNLAEELFETGDFKESLEAAQLAIELCEKEGYLAGIAQMLYRKGFIYRIQRNFSESLKYFYLSLEHFQTLGSELDEASVLNHIGVIYRTQGNNPAALELLFESLKIFQKHSEQTGIASVLNNIGIVYFYQNNFEKALEYYLASLEIEEELDAGYGISVSYINIGEAYKNMGNYKEALDYFLKALVLVKKYEEQDREGDSVGILYNEIGSIYLSMGNYILSKSYLTKAYDIFNVLGDKQRIAESEVYLGELAYNEGRFIDAKQFFSSALNNAQDVGVLNIVAKANKKLSLVYEKLNNIPEAYAHYKKHVATRDSLYNEDDTKRIVQAEMLYQFEKQMQEARVAQAKRDVKSQEAVARQKLIRNFLGIMLLMLLVVVVIIYNGYKNKKEANTRLAEQQRLILEKNEELTQQQEEILSQRDEIEKKNNILEHSQQIIEAKNDRIISSIEYAQTIQQAILPDKEQLSKYFPQHMVLFLPKDIVSGDFYWFSAIDNLLFAAVVDCTGHGVPGAFMSLIGNTLLNKIVNEWQTLNPAMILELMHKQVRIALNQETNSSKAHASMDICLLAIDTEKRRGTYAGASRPIYIVQNGTIERIPGNPRSVGGIQLEKQRFYTTHDIDFSVPTSIYLTTDGYIDQMNPLSKKFGQRKFKNLLMDIHQKPTQEQSNLLLDALEKHRQGHDQIDDICILGLVV